jgi:hypothetical protein
MEDPESKDPFVIEEHCAPQKLSEFVGNKLAVKQLTNWIREIIENPKYPRRVCFLTGATGAGKSTLAKLALKEAKYTVREFLASDMRIKNNREKLYQYMQFLDVLALFARGRTAYKKNPFKKAAIVECIENIGLCTQEIYRTIREMIKKKNTLGVPLIFTGTKPFRGKKPMSANAVFIHMRPRSTKDMMIVLQHCLNKLLELKDSPRLKKIKADKKTQLEIVRKAAGDSRRMIKFLEYAFSSKGEKILLSQMEENFIHGPMACLGRILRHDIEQPIETIARDAEMEGTMPFAVHGAYLEYVPWAVKGSPEKSSHVIRKISELLVDYNDLIDAERKSQFWGMNEIAKIITCFGPRTLINTELKTKRPKRKAGKNVLGWTKPFKRVPSGVSWWIELEKGRRRGDESVSVPCMNKTLRSALTNRQQASLAFQMVVQKHGDAKAWKPGTIHHTAQLLRLCDKSFSGIDRVKKVGLSG